MRTRIITAGLLSLAFTGAAFAAPPAPKADAAFASKLKLEDFRQLAVQEGGRRKPLDSFSREIVFKITDRKSFEGQDPVLTMLSMAFELNERWLDKRCIAVRNLDLIALFQKELKFEGKRRGGARFFISVDDFSRCREAQKIYRQAIAKARKRKPRNKLEKAVLEASERIFVLRSVRTLLTVLPTSDAIQDKWVSIDQADARFGKVKTAQASLIEALRKRDAESFNKAVGQLTSDIQGFDFKAYPYFGLLELEVGMNQFKPFQVAQLIYLISMLLLIASAMGKESCLKPGMTVFYIGVSLHILALVGRGLLVARSPVASLYETLVFMTGFAALLAFTLEQTSGRKGHYALAATIVAFCGLFLGDWHPIYADKQAISPLVPVLRSYWLNIHVSCMIASYGACLLAAAMGAIYIVRYCLNGGQEFAKTKEMVELEQLSYRTIQVGFLLLTIGVILGGVWANQSWGRYWDWDPKETWSFITWIGYAVYLHMRLMGHTKYIGTAILNLCAFWSVMFTYLGVSYVLPGLHSYVPAGEASYSSLMPFIYIPAIIAAGFGGLWLYGRNNRPPELAAGAAPKAEDAPKADDAEAEDAPKAKDAPKADDAKAEDAPKADDAKAEDAPKADDAKAEDAPKADDANDAKA